MSSSQKAKIAFTLALVLLCLSGFAAGFVIIRIYRVEALVRHTYDVEVAIGDLESSLARVGRNRVAYVDSATPESLQSFTDAVNRVSIVVDRIRRLTADNPAQRVLCDRLEANAKRRVDPSRKSVELKQQNQSDPGKQLQLTFQVANSAFETAAIVQEMRRNEDGLLNQRSRLSDLLFYTILGILSLSFVVSGLMFWLHYRLLNRELDERTAAENQLRQLSLQLMKVQDEEHRRFARELHDGLGQNLVGAKMMVDGLLSKNSEDDQIAELAAILRDAVSQTRTISYLFHPPLLDEVGFASAASWLIEGYAQRTGVAVSVNIQQLEQRLPQSVELTLYRVLQEGLNNIHRHSKSTKAEVGVQVHAGVVILRIKDNGQGISNGVLDAFRVGVGLTGMKERVREQGGELEMRSEPIGTEIVVKIPLTANPASADPAGPSPFVKVG